jgi:hypothetical protein
MTSLMEDYASSGEVSDHASSQKNFGQMLNGENQLSVMRRMNLPTEHYRFRVFGPCFDCDKNIGRHLGIA